VAHPFVHPTAIVEPGAVLGPGSKVWHFCHVRAGAELGADVSLGRDVYVDGGVRLGEGSRVQNGVSIYAGLTIGRFCFVGPHVIFTNDPRPRAGNKRWTISPTLLEDGAAIGAGSVIRCGVTVGRYAMIGAGTLVTRDVEPFRLVVGRPGRVVGVVCACGQSSLPEDADREALIGECCRELMTPASLAVARESVAGLATGPG